MFLWLIYFHALIKGFLLKEEIGLIFSLCITFHCPKKSKSLVSVDPELIKKPLIVWFFRGEKRLQSEAFVTLFEVLKSICICFICNVTCFVQYQSPHLEFGSQYRRILFGYQARIFDFSFLNVSHKSLSFITWNLIEYLHTQDFQGATAHLNVWANTLLCNFSKNSARSI